MKIAGQITRPSGTGHALGDIDEVKMSIYHDMGHVDHVLIEHDRDLNEVRVIVNNEAVWSTLERE